MTTTISVAETGTPGDGRPIAVGSRVRLIDNYGAAEFIMVPVEEPARATARHISVKSRLGHALLGRMAGERVEIQTPLGAHVVRILDVY
jgi:transcription elongation GreA/GreB family factor